MSTINNSWITIVLITAIIMLVFLVFYGNKSPTTSYPLPLPQEKKVEELKVNEPAPQVIP